MSIRRRIVGDLDRDGRGDSSGGVGLGALGSDMAGQRTGRPLLPARVPSARDPTDPPTCDGSCHDRRVVSAYQTVSPRPDRGHRRARRGRGHRRAASASSIAGRAASAALLEGSVTALSATTPALDERRSTRPRTQPRHRHQRAAAASCRRLRGRCYAGRRLRRSSEASPARRSARMALGLVTVERPGRPLGPRYALLRSVAGIVDYFPCGAPARRLRRRLRRPQGAPPVGDRGRQELRGRQGRTPASPSSCPASTTAPGRRPRTPSPTGPAVRRSPRAPDPAQPRPGQPQYAGQPPARRGRSRRASAVPAAPPSGPAAADQPTLVAGAAPGARAAGHRVPAPATGPRSRPTTARLAARRSHRCHPPACAARRRRPERPRRRRRLRPRRPRPRRPRPSTPEPEPAVPRSARADRRRPSRVAAPRRPSAAADPTQPAVGPGPQRLHPVRIPTASAGCSRRRHPAVARHQLTPSADLAPSFTDRRLRSGRGRDRPEAALEVVLHDARWRGGRPRGWPARSGSLSAAVELAAEDAAAADRAPPG